MKHRNIAWFFVSCELDGSMWLGRICGWPHDFVSTIICGAQF